MGLTAQIRIEEIAMSPRPQQLLLLAIVASLTACVASDNAAPSAASGSPASMIGTVRPVQDPPAAEVQVMAPPPAPEVTREQSVLRDRSSAQMPAAIANSLTVFKSVDAAAAAPAGRMARNEAVLPGIYQQITNTERYQHLDDNPVHLTAEQPVSTFSVDVDTGSYANVRRYLNAGQLPPQDATRVEEMINYFDYDYAAPVTRATPFKVSTELAPAPWNVQAVLLKIGIKGYELPANERPPANLVFLIDVSGSMQSPDKLPLLKNAFRMLTEQLTARDRVSMVVYAGSAGVVLEPTAGDQKYKIREAIERLEAGGSTNGADGIKRAYQLAHDTYIKNGINRVVLATDGDFNVGVVNFEALVDVAERERSSGVALTTLGFGAGNYNDQLMERLADAGNGNYAYIDTLSEARKVLVSELASTLVTIAKDVKIQIEFNPATVQEYRLIGYENRLLAREDFNNDKVDAGEIGAGHRVTALYELIPVGKQGRIDASRYAQETTRNAGSDEFGYLRLRYKQPDADTSQLLNYPIKRQSVSAAAMSPDLAFAASVAAFGQRLRGGKYLGEFGYADIRNLAQHGMGKDSEGYRHEFVSLVKLAESLDVASGQSQRVSQVRD
jgi:Ca-activated chloride channel homolog